MEKTNKELALSLIENLQEIASKDDKELQRLYRLENPHHAAVGESAISYHLKVLKELVEQI